MKWDGDPNKEIKHHILEYLRLNLSDQDASRITFRQVCDAIDEMIDKLINLP